MSRYMYKRLESCSSASFAHVNGVFLLLFFKDIVHKFTLLVGDANSIQLLTNAAGVQR